MEIKKSTDAIYDMIESATSIAKERFEEEVGRNSGYATLVSRVALLKEFGTIRIGLGRCSGNSTAAIRFANNFFENSGLRTIYFGPCPDHYLEMGAEESYRWTDAADKDPTHIAAIFVDPGPHAGMQAQRAIYTFAAEAMLSGEDGLNPVFIYFIGS